MVERPKVSVVIPTYNERDNVATIIPLLSDVLQKTGVTFEIVVVDDSSPDGTADVVRELATKFPVKLIVRPAKLGIGSAIRDGVLASSGDYVVVMDADLQHPPEVVPQLVEKLDGGYDIAIASRYVSGGKIENWSLARRVISRGAILLAHALLPGTRRVKDAVSGFFAFKRSIVDINYVSAQSMKVLLDILCTSRTEKVCEVPYVFKGRAKGHSKLAVKDILAYAKHVFSLFQHCKHYYYQPNSYTVGECV